MPLVPIDCPGVSSPGFRWPFESPWGVLLSFRKCTGVYQLVRVIDSQHPARLSPNWGPGISTVKTSWRSFCSTVCLPAKSRTCSSHVSQQLDFVTRSQRSGEAGDGFVDNQRPSICPGEKRSGMLNLIDANLNSVRPHLWVYIS
jgi:hypothetical protein